MQYTTLTLAALVSLAFGQSGPQFRFSEYGNNDQTCNPQNLISPSISIPGSGDPGNCIQFPVGTSSVQYALLEGSQAGCTVELWTNNACGGPAIGSYVPAVGEQTCRPPLGGGWSSVRVTCP